MKKKVLALSGVLAGLVVSAETVTIPVFVLDAETDKPVRGARIVMDCERFGRIIRGYIDNAYTQKFTETDVTDASGQCAFDVEKVPCKFSFHVRPVPYNYYYTSQYENRAANDQVWKEYLDLLVKPVKFYVYAKVHPADLKEYAVKGQKVHTLDYPYNRRTEDLWKTANNVLKLDMIKGDWLPPAGAGEQADVVFTRLPRQILGQDPDSQKADEMFCDEVRVEFTGAGNGLYVIPKRERGDGCPIRMAPESGYVKMTVLTVEYRGRANYKLQDQVYKNYCFRIRTQTNDVGKIVSAYYGKSLKGLKPFPDSSLVGIDFGGVTNCSHSLDFNYNLNMTPLDRNVE